MTNNDIGLHVYYDSNLYTGYGSHLQPSHSGYNSIHGNAIYDATAGSGSNNVSMWNWWGTTFPQSSQFDTSGDGVMDYDYWLTSAPSKSGTVQEDGPSTKAKAVAGEFVRQVYETASQSISDAEDLTQAHMNDADVRIAKKARMLYANLLMRRDAISGVSYLEELRGEGIFDHWERATIVKQLFYAYLDGDDRTKATEMLGELRRHEDEDWESGLLAAVYEDVTGERPILPAQESSPSTDDAVSVESYPDPFNAAASIRYHVTEKGPVTVRIYDAVGRKVTTLVDERKASGTYTTRFNASGLPSGVYMYRVTTAAGTAAGQMHLVK